MCASPVGETDNGGSAILQTITGRHERNRLAGQGAALLVRQTGLREVRRENMLALLRRRSWWLWVPACAGMTGGDSAYWAVPLRPMRFQGIRVPVRPPGGFRA